VNQDSVAKASEYARRALEEQADPEKAKAMQSYMKTDMPFYGVQKKSMVPILRQITRDFPPQSQEEYERLVRGLWELPHREEKHLALGVAVRNKAFITSESIGLYKQLIVEGHWWDLVDDVATHMIRPLVIGFPSETWPAVDTWIDDDDMWLRRTAIICQVGAKESTDPDRLFDFCQRRMHEKEFFIRKAIGWALREYAKTDGPAVAAFATTHRESLSGLSYREATKHIKDLVDS